MKKNDIYLLLVLLLRLTTTEGSKEFLSKQKDQKISFIIIFNLELLHMQNIHRKKGKINS